MVKGNILKVKRQTKIAVSTAFRQLLNGLSSDDLNGLKRMFEHGMQQNSKKLEKAIEWSKEIQNLNVLAWKVLLRSPMPLR